MSNEVTPCVNSVSHGEEHTKTTAKDTFMEQVEKYITFKIVAFIDAYWFPVLVPIGLVGNTLSFLVMVKPNNRKVSTCIFMAAISINDNLMMYICIHALVVLKMRGRHLIECKLVGAFGLYALQNSTFQVLAMTATSILQLNGHTRQLHSVLQEEQN